jgi:hypothetical protein
MILLVVVSSILQWISQSGTGAEARLCYGSGSTPPDGIDSIFLYSAIVLQKKSASTFICKKICYFIFV